MSKQYYKIYSGQSLLDIALEVYGDIGGVFTLLEDNPAITSLDDDLQVGQALLVDDNKAVNAEVARYFRFRELKINGGAYTETSEVIDLNGLISLDEVLLISFDNEILKANDQ